MIYNTDGNQNLCQPAQVKEIDSVQSFKVFNYNQTRLGWWALTVGLWYTENDEQ